jgi:hypothetical protein
MYFHAHHNSIDQRTFVTTSKFGLDFNGNIRPVALGRSYCRIFEAGGELYAIANEAELFKALDPDDPWAAPKGFDFKKVLWDKLPDNQNPFVKDIDAVGLLPMRMRHPGVYIKKNTLYVFYSRKEDYIRTGEPERILLSTIDLSAGGWENWDSTFPPEEIIQAEMPWQGADLPRDTSKLMCDPFVFEDIGGRVYLFYSAGLEKAIGLCELKPSSKK